MKAKLIPTKLIVMIALPIVCTLGFAQQTAVDIVTIVKITGIGWFDRMEKGVKAYALQSDAAGRITLQVGPKRGDSAAQIKVIENALENKAKAIAVVPLDGPVLETILKKAIDQGVKVVTHEADTQRYTHADVEAFSNTAYGARLNERLAKCMTGEGKWTVFVGSLGSQTHVQWADGGIDNARKLHPKMRLVDPKLESINDAERAYQKAKEVLRKYPDIRGFQGSSSVDVIGIGRAVQEAGLEGKTCVFGTGLPSETAAMLASGAIDGISLWDPMDAGLVMNRIAGLLIEGKPILDGMNLGVPGYNRVNVKKGPGIGVIVTGEAWLDVDATNYKQFNF